MRAKRDSIRTAMVISAAVMFFCLAGVILQFSQTKVWDSTGCSVIALNTAIFFASLTAYNKAGN